MDWLRKGGSYFHRLNPFRKVLINPSRHSDDQIREMAPRLAIAVGLALRSFD